MFDDKMEQGAKIPKERGELFSKSGLKFQFGSKWLQLGLFCHYKFLKIQ